MSKTKSTRVVYPKTRRQPVARATPEILREKFQAFAQLFPEALAEGKLDWDKLKDALGEFGDERPDRYSFTWAGKRQAIQLLQTPSRATLEPAPKESVNFDATQHLFIEGDNLEVLKLLYKAYFGQVKMIFIDPPYNTGNDFIYPDNFADPLDTYLKLTGQKTAEGNLLTSNPETSGRYHSAWLSMMYPRLFLARQLLRDDGVIFVSINDVECANLTMLLNEVFGEENRLAIFTWKSRAKPTNAGDAIYRPQLVAEYVLAYAKDAASTAFNPLFSGEKRSYPHADSSGRRYRTTTILSSNLGRYKRETMRFEIAGFRPSELQRWKAGEDEIKDLHSKGYIEFRDGTPFLKHYEEEEKEEHDPLWSFLPEDWTDTAESGKAELKELIGPKHGLDSVKPVALIKLLLQAVTNDTDMVMDFFAGSCTTAQSVLELNREANGNRRFIMVQLPEPTNQKEFPTIADIGKERIRRVIKKLAKEKSGELDLKTRETPEDLGFRVFKLAESNFKPWPEPSAVDAKQYAETMELYTDPLRDGWQPVNVLHEVAIKEGYGLACRLEKLKEAKDLTLYRVTDPDKEQSFYLCLDDKIAWKALKPVTLKRDDLFICRDTALTDDAAANLALQCRLKTI